jgi:hypothetical protein
VVSLGSIAALGIPHLDAFRLEKSDEKSKFTKSVFSSFH